jgi:hypothetical protein
VDGYSPPVVADFGDLAELTSAAHLYLGQAGAPDLSFSSPEGSVGGVSSDGKYSGSDPGSGTASGGGGAGGGGAGAGGAASGAGSGGGGKLPFTGFAAGAAGAVGAGLVAAGGALRRAVRDRRGSRGSG